MISQAKVSASERTDPTLPNRVHFPRSRDRPLREPQFRSSSAARRPETHFGESPGDVQLLGVAAIIDAAVSILIPILHRLSKAEVTREGEIAADIDAEIAKLRERIAELERGKQPRS
jgi:hypothetical protein